VLLAVSTRGIASPAHSSPAPSGEQFEIVCGDQRATIVEVGGGIREYEHDGRRVLDPYPLTAICDGAHGAPLIPWPNRVGDGRYRFDGVEHQLALTEPAKHNAIHGLLRWRLWHLLEREPERVTLGTRLLPLTGYPFALDLTIAYELEVDGLAVTTTATNIGEDACPYAVGQHPYLSPGGARLDECELTLPAATRILTDERQLPCGREPVQGTDFDFRGGRRLGEQRLDSPFTDLIRDSAGIARARLSAPDGSCVELWADARYTVLELYTGDTLAPARRRRGLGLEPMSCPPNALQSGEGLVRLEAGESLRCRWGARLS
jgi:aldose 1-epimerase